MEWVASEHVKVDRVASPRLTRRFSESSAAEWTAYDPMCPYCKGLVRQGEADGAFKG